MVQQEDLGEVQDYQYLENKEFHEEMPAQQGLEEIEVHRSPSQPHSAEKRKIGIPVIQLSPPSLEPVIRNGDQQQNVLKRVKMPEEFKIKADENYISDPVWMEWFFSLKQ
ncbi:UNVERIFIED_CONTAM: hypothetical protein K2H54_074719 [Gekko kuhli]